MHNEIFQIIWTLTSLQQFKCYDYWDLRFRYMLVIDQIAV